MKSNQILSILALALLSVLSLSSAQACSGLQSASTFAAIASSTITNTGPTHINSNIGVYPGTAVTGFPPGKLVGDMYTGDATAALAIAQVATFFSQFEPSSACTNLVTLSNIVLTPGTYCFSGSAALTGTLVLNGLGQSAPVFIFVIPTTLVLSSGSAVTLTNGAVATGIYWNVGTSATLGVQSNFNGILYAHAAITVDAGTHVNGKLFAGSAITFDDADLVSCEC